MIVPERWGGSSSRSGRVYDKSGGGVHWVASKHVAQLVASGKFTADLRSLGDKDRSDSGSDSSSSSSSSNASSLV